MIRRRVIVHGRVQGVFFRESLRRMAESRRVGGWARNRDDGGLEAVFEGETDAVEALVEFCRRGPSSARVAELEVFDDEPEELEGFRVG